MAETIRNMLDRMDDPSKRIEIYTCFMNKAILEDSDREDLKNKRGFTDEIIDLCQFKSCRPENREIIEEISKLFSEEDLIEVGILEATDSGVKPCGQLLGIYNKKGQFVNNICVPYFNADGEIFFLRPHKFGFKGLGINIYCPAHDLSPDKTWIITESEFKAAATIQFGYPSIGVPGIHSFAENHFGRLKAFIEALGISKIVVIYDNEIKTNPEFSNFKPDVFKQWDTQWRAIDICRKLIKNIPDLTSVKVGVLPDAWMEEGKIDIDGALAQGRSQSEFKAVVYRALTWRSYLESLPSVARKIITRKVYREDFLDRSKVIKKDNSYFIKKKKKVGRGDTAEIIDIEESVSNFTMDIRKVLVEEDTHVREVIFRGQDGSKSKPYMCNKGSNILRDFKVWAHSHGDYIFTGRQEELDMIWQLEGAMCDGREILRPEQIGKLKENEEALWLFGNALIKEDDGTILQPDKEGIIWSGLTGYLPRSIKVSAKSKVSIKATQVPTVNLHDKTVDLLVLKEVVKKMEKIWGTKAVYLAVGWIIACLLSEEIHHRYGCFPILFIGGKRESGKTTLAQWLMALGGQHDPVGSSLEGTTQPGAVRHLAWYSSLAYWMDEYRNNSKVKKWDGFFRNAYNRQSPSKGTLGAGVRSQSINAGILLSGEETPHDNALLSRCVVIPLGKRAKDAQEDFKDIEVLRTNASLSQLILEVIKVKKALLPTVLDHIDGWKKRLLDAGVGPRISLNYAIPAVCYDAIFLRNESLEVRQEFTRWVVEESHRTELEKESEHMLAVFMEDLVTLHEQLDGFYNIFTQNKETKGKRRIALHFPTFYTRWTETYRRKGHEQFKRPTMLGYIREESYYIKDNALRRVGGKPMRSLILSLDPEDNPPDGLLYLADGRAEGEESIKSAIEGISSDDNDLF